jgi:hypothetical protein
MRGTRKDWDEPTRDAVEVRVAAFLDRDQRPSIRGGFADVPEGDMDELDALILNLVKYRYAPDPDGDRPVKWSLCDWSRFQPHNFQYLPHSDENGDKDEEQLDIALLNLDMAMSEVRRIRNILQIKRSM